MILIKCQLYQNHDVKCGKKNEIRETLPLRTSAHNRAKKSPKLFELFN